MVRLLWQKQTLLRLQLLVLSPTSDYGLALAKATYSRAATWDKELSQVKSSLAKKKVSIYPDQFLNLVYHVVVQATVLAQGRGGIKGGTRSRSGRTVKPPLAVVVWNCCTGAWSSPALIRVLNYLL